MCAQFADAIVVTSEATGTRRWLTPVETLAEGGRMIVIDTTHSSLTKSMPEGACIATTN